MWIPLNMPDTWKWGAKLSTTVSSIWFRPYYCPESKFWYKVGAFKFGTILNITLVKILGNANKHCQDRTYNLTLDNLWHLCFNPFLHVFYGLLQLVFSKTKLLFCQAVRRQDSLSHLALRFSLNIIITYYNSIIIVSLLLTGVSGPVSETPEIFN